jgi:hypothetical protein
VDAERAQTLAERLHHDQRDAAGAPLLDHVRRVAAAVPENARVVAWLHEVLEYTSISEHELLAQGLSLDELRALRLLTHSKESRSDTSYLAQVELIERASGAGANIARSVKLADLSDRNNNPSTRADGWSPPYERGLQILRRAARHERHSPNAGPEARAHKTPVGDVTLPAPAARVADRLTAGQSQRPAAEQGR